MKKWLDKYAEGGLVSKNSLNRKVTCSNCGWSWKLSDSSAKDMYICHECGRDNSNNMKNGGWLDSYADGETMQEHQENYNDYKVSAPKGMVGDGFFNVGRNYSPAWGGQFEDGGSVYPVNYVPEAQWGLSVGPFTPIVPLAISAVNKVKSWFSDDAEQVKPIKKPVAKDKPRTLNIVDPRKKMATTNQPLRPNSDLVGGKYNSKHLDKLMQEAKRQGLSKQDMINLSAMGFQETKWGRSDGNIGHVLGDWGGRDSYSDFVNAYKAKMKEADRLGIKDPALRLQVYNGMGTVTPKTEKNYHGFEMQKIYGVPIPKEGINMKKNPLYGKQVMDIRDNVLAKNPEYVQYMDSIYKAPVPEYMEDVRMNKQKPPKNIQGRPQLAHQILTLLKKKEMGGSLPRYQSIGEVKEKIKYPVFNPTLIQQNRPIIDVTAAPILLPPNLNYDKTRVVNSSSRGLNKTQLKNINQNLRNRVEQEKKQELEEYKAAQLFHNNNPVAQFLGTRSAPVSSVKPTARELAYGLGAGINEFYDIPGIGIVNDFVNPLSLVSKGIISPWAQAPLQAQQSDSYLPYLGAAASTALTVPMVRPASMVAKTFLNPRNIYRGIEGTGRYLTKPTSVSSSVDDVGRSLDLEELRRAYHNSERFLQPEESRFLHKHGHGLRENYRTQNSIWNRQNNLTDNELYLLSDIVEHNNQLPPPPSEIQFMPDGTTRTIYNQQPISSQAWGTGNWSPNNPVHDTFDLNKLEKPINRSGLSKEEVLEKASGKDKDAISKMSDREFKNTVLKPNGEIVSYKPGPEIEQMTFDPVNRHMVLKDQISMSTKEYTDAFNERLDLLNDIIAKRNKSGIDYSVKGLNEDGRLIFNTPEQVIPVKLTPKQQANIEWFNRSPEHWLKNKAGLKQEGNKWRMSDEAGGEEFNSIEEAIKAVREEMKHLTEPKTISGESIWSTNINPGQWRGNVEDIANTEYFRSIPGLEMKNTTSGVFADHVARRGTGAYESINEYLKKLNLGRVKPGFNSQTEFSRGAWENFIKTGRGVGFYGNPGTVYGSMRSLFPYIGIGGAGVLGAGAASQFYNGQGEGEINQYADGGKVKDKKSTLSNQKGGPIITNRGQWDYPGQTTIIPSNKITMTGVDYPVIGVDNTGHTKMMQPGMDYTFPGQYVTEYPMMQGGGGFISNLKKAYVDAYNNYNSRTFPAETLPQRQKAYRTINPSSYLDLRNYGRWVSDEQRDESYDPRSEEAFKFYLGLSTPDELKYLKKSKYIPTINAVDKNYYTVDPQLEQDIFNSYKDKVKLKEILQTDESEIETPISGKDGAGLLGRFGVSRGRDKQGDYLSYYDRYDLKDFAQKRTKGMPYSIYNRIYYPKKEQGGEMIKRADGSYSKRGLWDNIRDNRGSGKVPTKQMLDQERKIKSHYQDGGEEEVYWRTKKPMVNDPSMDAISKVLLQRNQDKNFMQRAAGLGYQGGIPTRYIEGQDPNSNNTSNLLMSFGDNQVFPTIIQTGPQQLSYQPNQMEEYIQTPTEDIADYFAAKGYKRAANDMYGMKYKNGGNISMYNNGGEPDGEMALGQIDAAINKLTNLRKFIQPNSDLEPWVSSKLTMVDDYANSVSDYMMYNPETKGMMELPIEEMEYGGIPERYKNMGFTKVGTKKQSTRPGKKWMVLAKKGDDYKVVHGGYKGMQDFKQHHSEQRRENFWNRMGGKNSSKATDPFSPLYWHKRFGTWQKGGQTSPNMEYASNYIYRYPATTFPCQGKGCSEQVSDELVQMGLTPQRTDAWFMNDVVQQSGGKEIWNQKNNTPVDYKNIRVGDIISLDRPGLHYIDNKTKKSKYKPEMDVEHVGVIIGFNENGVPLVKHGGADENTVVQPINDVFLNVLSTGIKLNYNPYSIYRLAGADTFIPNQKYYDKYYEDIKPVFEKIQPLNIKTDKLTLDKEKFISALNNNLEKQSRALGISPNDVQQLQKIAYGVFGNESKFNASQLRNIKEPIKRIFYGLNLTDNSPSLGVTRIKYDDLVNKNNTKVAKIFSDLGVKKNKLQGLKSDLEYNDEANATVGLLGYYFNKLKEKDENGNYKYNFNPKTNTVFDNVPIGIAVASLYNRPAGLKNYKKRVYPKQAYTHIKEDMTSLPLFQVNLDPVYIKSADKKYINNNLRQSAIELPENLRSPQLSFMNIKSRYAIGGQSTLNPIVKKDNKNWLEYLKN
jgi:hypothetical protein